MNQVFAGATALILTILLLGFGKKPQLGALLKKNNHHIFNPNNEEISLVKAQNFRRSKQSQFDGTIEEAWEKPRNVRERLSLEKRLYRLISGNPEERLEAIIISDLWGHPNVLPILRRGLKDADSYVVKAAASALNKHRVAINSRTNQKSIAQRPPRNVSLMR